MCVCEREGGRERKRERERERNTQHSTLNTQRTLNTEHSTQDQDELKKFFPAVHNNARKKHFGKKASDSDDEKSVSVISPLANEDEDWNSMDIWAEEETPPQLATQVSADKVPGTSGVIRFSELLVFQRFPCRCMEGYLQKCSMRHSHRRKRLLQKRYFVLQGSFLSYHKSHSAKHKACKDLAWDLRGMTIAKAEGDGIRLSRLGRVVFLVFAQTEERLDMWLRFFEGASAL